MAHSAPRPRTEVVDNECEPWALKDFTFSPDLFTASPAVISDADGTRTEMALVVP